MALEDAKKQVDHAFTRKDRKGLAYENAFGGATSFLRRHYSKDLTGRRSGDHRRAVRSGGDTPDRHPVRAARDPRGQRLQPYDPPYGWDGFDPLSRFRHRRLWRSGL